MQRISSKYSKESRGPNAPPCCGSPECKTNLTTANDEFKSLIDDIDYTKNPSTRLHYICSNLSLCNIEEIVNIIENGADVNATDYLGYSPLQCLLMMKNTNVCTSLIQANVCEILINNGAHVNTVNTLTGHTPLNSMIHYLLFMPESDSFWKMRDKCKAQFTTIAQLISAGAKLEFIGCDYSVRIGLFEIFVNWCGPAARRLLRHNGFIARRKVQSLFKLASIALRQSMNNVYFDSYRLKCKGAITDVCYNFVISESCQKTEYVPGTELDGYLVNVYKQGRIQKVCSLW